MRRHSKPTSSEPHASACTAGRPGRVRLAAATLACLSALAATGCSRIINGPASAHDVVERPTAIVDFHALYTTNCSACHGEEGKGGPAVDMNNPLYLAVVSDDTLRADITNGGPGGQMPAFGSTAGGLLTSDQVNVIVHGMRQRWAKPAMFAGMSLPPYAASHQGNPSAGLLVYNQACARCHGEAQPDGSIPKAGSAGSVIDPTYLSLVSDQDLRTVTLAGRPELGMPDYRNDLKGQPLTDAQLTDVVAWMSSHRPPGVEQNANATQGSDKHNPAATNAAQQYDQTEAKAAQQPAASDKGKVPEPPKAKKAKKAEKEGGMIREEGR